MESKHDLKTVPPADCDCCQLSPDHEAQPYGCSERRLVFTHREQKVLKKIRELAQQARTIKERLKKDYAEGNTSSKAHNNAVEELDRLRLIRAELERERIAAAEERMRLLGHA